MKNKSDFCLRCGRPRNSKEKSIGCYVYGKLISKRHLYSTKMSKKELPDFFKIK